MKWSSLKRSLPVLLTVSLIVTNYAWGQLGASTIRGTITDPSGAAVSGASITLTNLETNQSRTQTTNSSGSYAFELVPPGEYRVQIEAKGFRKKVVNSVQALVAAPRRFHRHWRSGRLIRR
jgi:protocatechuate 3,4-dioxygenase beta subunit